MDPQTSTSTGNNSEQPNKTINEETSVIPSTIQEVNPNVSSTGITSETPKIKTEKQGTELSETMQLIQENNIKEFEEHSNQQMENIKNEQLKVQIIGHPEPIASLLVEYEGSPNFLKKIKYMQNSLNKTSIRRIRKDGSCFYRAFLFGLARNYLRGTLDFKEGKYAFENVSFIYYITKDHKNRRRRIKKSRIFTNCLRRFHC